MGQSSTQLINPEPPKKWYVVFKSVIPGIYDSWEQAQPMVKGFKNNLYRKYKSYDEAVKGFETFLNMKNKGKQNE